LEENDFIRLFSNKIWYKFESECIKISANILIEQNEII